MNRGGGAGLIVFGIVLVVIGAILKYAVTVHSTSVDVSMIGLIVLIVGAVTFGVGLVITLLGGRRRTTIREDIRTTAGGTERVQQQEDWTP